MNDNKNSTVNIISKNIMLYRKEIKRLKELNVKLENELMELIKDDVFNKLDDNYGTGTVNNTYGDIKIKTTVRKKVKYDQDGLKKAWEELSNIGQEPSKMIDVKLDINENRYKNWPEQAKNIVEAYRTVEPSKPTIVVENV
jgi:3-deoxy-D-arabino-heptulosonate 7-phosphate (DAHP) synthase